MNSKVSELTKMLVYGKGMKRIGRVADLEVNMESRLIERLIVKLDGEDAKKAWKGKLQLRSPKISIPAEYVSSVKDAVQLQRTLEEMKGNVKKA